MKRICNTVCYLAVVLLLTTPPSYSEAQQQREIRPDRENRDIRVVRDYQRTSYSAHAQDEVVVKFEGDTQFTRIKTRNNEKVSEALSRLRGRADVQYAEPNYIAYATYVPDDTYYPLQWNLDNPTNGSINMEQAWDVSTGEDVVVAIIDTGVAYERYRQNWRNNFYQAPDLADTDFVSGYDFVNNDTHPNDDQGHGTHVAGTIAQSTNNDLGTAGVAFNASIMPLKVLNSSGSGTYADIAEAIRFAADNGAHVINMSLGGSSGASYLEEALAYAYSNGVTIVASAGNNGQNNLSFPAAYDNYVIAVGATRFDETRTSYSNYGSSLDIVAPGGDTSVDQNGDGYADGILQQTFGNRHNDWGYYFYQGTSMASPHVAGAAALLYANGNATTPDEVRAALESTTKDLGTSGFDTTYGYGLVDVYAALQWNTGPVDNPPTVTLTTPAEGMQISGMTLLQADASDDESVTAVRFYADNILLTTDTTLPYKYDWDSTTVSDGSHTITAVAVDTASQERESQVTVTVENVNEAPSIDSTPPTTANENALYTYQAIASDSDPGDTLTYTLDTPPAGMSVNSTSGLVSWTPSDTQTGDHTVVVTATDAGGLSNIQSYTLTVSAGPVLTDEITVFTESFETGLGQWEQDSQNDWRVSTQRSTDGRYSTEIDGRATNATLTSLPIDLQGKTNVTITFSWLIERRFDTGEHIYFSVSTDGGSTWTEHARLRGNVDRENVWQDESIELSNINTLELRFAGTVSSRSEDANVDMVSVLGF